VDEVDEALSSRRARPEAVAPSARTPRRGHRGVLRLTEERTDDIVEADDRRARRTRVKARTRCTWPSNSCARPAVGAPPRRGGIPSPETPRRTGAPPPGRVVGVISPFNSRSWLTIKSWRPRSPSATPCGQAHQNTRWSRRPHRQALQERACPPTPERPGDGHRRDRRRAHRALRAQGHDPSRAPNRVGRHVGAGRPVTSSAASWS